MVKAWWFKNEGENFGDAICPFILNKLTEQEVVHSDDPMALASIGSILFYNFGSPKTIWGSGAISEYHNSKVVREHDIRAVRGPHSRKRLLNIGLSCPEVYGDPSILLPLFVDNNSVSKEHEVSFLPHWVDLDILRSNKKISDKFNIIDIRSGVHKVMSEILKSKIIISSSLHGIIVPEAFGIKSYLIRMSDNVTGGLYKFEDYYFSTNRMVRCHDLRKSLDRIDVDETIDMYENADPVFDIKGLLGAFPHEIKNKKALEILNGI